MPAILIIIDSLKGLAARVSGTHAKYVYCSANTSLLGCRNELHACLSTY